MSTTGPAYIRFEEAVLEVFRAVEVEGVTAEDAYNGVADAWDITPERLQSITRMWCALAPCPLPEDV